MIVPTLLILILCHCHAVAASWSHIYILGTIFHLIYYYSVFDWKWIIANMKLIFMLTTNSTQTGGSLYQLQQSSSRYLIWFLSLNYFLCDCYYCYHHHCDVCVNICFLSYVGSLHWLSLWSKIFHINHTKHLIGTTHIHINQQLKLHEADPNQEQQDSLHFYGNNPRWYRYHSQVLCSDGTCY